MVETNREVIVLFNDPHYNVLVPLEGCRESLDVTNLANVVDDEEDVPVFGPVGEGVVIYLGNDGLLAPRFLAEFDVDGEVDLLQGEIRNVGLGRVLEAVGLARVRNLRAPRVAIIAARMETARSMWPEPDRAPAPSSMGTAGAGSPACTANAHANTTATPYSASRSGTGAAESRRESGSDRPCPLHIRVRLQRCPIKIHVPLGIQHEYGLCLCRTQLNG